MVTGVVLCTASSYFKKKVMNLDMRFRDLVNNLDHFELLALKKDLIGGATATKKLIDDKIKENEKGREKFCAVCDRKLDQYSTNYTILFGPDDFKKRASFCEIDCLEYFVSKLKNMGEVEETDGGK